MYSFVRSQILCQTSFDTIIAWRLVVALSLIPAFGTLYQRLTLAESTRFIEATQRPADMEALDPKRERTAQESSKDEPTTSEINDEPTTSTPPQVPDVIKQKAPFKCMSRQKISY